MHSNSSREPRPRSTAQERPTTSTERRSPPASHSASTRSTSTAWVGAGSSATSSPPWWRRRSATSTQPSWSNCGPRVSAIIAPRDAAKAYLAAADEFGRAKLADVDGLDAFNDAADAIIAHVDGSALALFAGVAAEPLPDDAPARAYRNAVTLRELRGSVHLLAIVAEGLHPATAHAIRRPGDVAMFGYEQAPVASDADQAALMAADARTDKLLAAWFEVLDDNQRTALADGADAIAAALGV